MGQQGISVEDLIKSKVSEFSLAEEKLAAHLMEQPEQWAFESAAQLAERLGMHRSTIVRFAQRLGFKGYPEFQSFLRQQLLRNFNPYPESVWGAVANKDSILQAVYSRELRNLQQTYAHLDTDLLDLTAQGLATAQNVLVFGRRFSYAIAFYLYTFLRLMRDGIRLAPDPGGSTIDAIFDLGPNDYGLVVSLRRHSPEVRRILEFLRRAKVPHTLLTDVNPVPGLSEETRVIRAHLGGSSILDSHTALISVAHALLTIVSLRIPGIEKRIEAVEHRWHWFNELAFRRRQE